MKRYYFDYAAATPIDPRVVKVMEPYWQKIFANPSSLHEEGRLAGQALDQAREKVATELVTKPAEIFFTSGGSEADNWAILGVARARKKDGKHIIISSIEHKAILNSVKYLQANGYEIDYCPVDEKGLLEMTQLVKLIRKETILISIILANNEIGTIQDIEKIARVVKERNKKTYLHTDACQALNYLDLDVNKMGVDLMTINASKIYGPRGVGVLYVKQGVEIEPLIFGGGQEKGMRAGTENVAGIVGLAEALTIASRIRQSENKRLVYLRDKIISRIIKDIPDVILNGDAKKRLPNNINFSFVGAEGESLVLYLDNKGIGVSTGSACSAADLNPSHVLLALGQSKELAHGSLRITLGRWTSEGGVEYLLKILPEIVTKVRSMSAIY